MTLKDFQYSFTPVSPLVRTDAEIGADLSGPGTATDATRAAVAAVESHVANGDSLYGRGQYSDALGEYRLAQAAILQILYPEFDVGAWARWNAPFLPVSAAVETSLLNASARIVDVIRPLKVPTPPVTRRFIADALPAPVQRFAATGFRESAPLDQRIQTASAQAAALLGDQKPEAAADLLSDTLAQIAGPPAGSVDPGLRASLELNLSAAYLQAGNPAGAAAHANAAAGLFKAAADVVGQAQAMHLSGVSAMQSGNPTQGQQLLQQAAALLKSASGTSSPPHGAPATLAAVRGTVVGAITGVRVGAVTPVAVVDGAAAAAAVQVPITRELGALDPIAKMSPDAVTFRVTGREDGWGVIPLPSPQVRSEQGKAWQVGVPAGAGMPSFSVAEGHLAASKDIVAQIYQPRIAATEIAGLVVQIVDASSTAFYLTHLYAYVLPVKIGDTYNKLGQFAHAETSYLQAAGYTYLNQALEAPALWVRIAQNATDWADTSYKAEDLPSAQAQYAKVVTAAGGVPASVLYSTPSLAAPAGTAKAFIQNLAARPIPTTSGEIAIVVLTAYSRLRQIAQNLDYYGLLLTPIHTFEYLQGVARGFAQEASQAEQQFINYTARQEAAEQTRRDLEATAAMAHADADSKYWQYQSAQDDARAAQAALDLANKRVADAVAERSAYQASSSAEIWAQAAAQALQGGQDAMYGDISELADKLARGETISGPGPKLAAAQTLYAGRKTQAYELQKMQDNIDELQKGVAVAQAQRDSASARAVSVEVDYQAALQRASLADAALQAFDGDFFTPETWGKMADVMRAISREYLFRGIRIAKLMERAYNFDNDTGLKVIKNDYGVSVAASATGRDTVLLGGDSLLADIDSFTFQAITTRTRKSSRIKDVISLASDYPAQFDAFRTSGLLKFETDLYELDRRHPGFYAQRIEAVEMELIGLLPDNSAPEGTLTAGGVTSFRKVDGSVGKRVHQIDTMALSSFTTRGDSFLYSTDTGVRGLFQGYGVGATWQMHLPRRSNDFDLRRILDVNLVLYYTAMYDAGLEATILATPPRPGELEQLRTFALRYDFPDIWYAFYQGGTAAFTLDAVRLPFNQQDFKVKSAQFRVVTKPGVSNQGIALTVTGPNGFSGNATTDANGAVSSAGAALAGLAGANPLGGWSVRVTGGASITDGGALKLDRVYNIQFGLEYSYDYVPEVV